MMMNGFGRRHGLRRSGDGLEDEAS